MNVLHDDNPIRDEELAQAEIGVERHQVRLREWLGRASTSRAANRQLLCRFEGVGHEIARARRANGLTPG